MMMMIKMMMIVVVVSSITHIQVGLVVVRLVERHNKSTRRGIGR